MCIFRLTGQFRTAGKSLSVKASWPVSFPCQPSGALQIGILYGWPGQTQATVHHVICTFHAAYTWLLLGQARDVPKSAGLRMLQRAALGSRLVATAVEVHSDLWAASLRTTTAELQCVREQGIRCLAVGAAVSLPNCCTSGVHCPGRRALLMIHRHHDDDRDSRS